MKNRLPLQCKKIKHLIRHFISYSLLTLVSFVGLMAQDFSQETQSYYYKENPSLSFAIDTSLYNFEQYNFNQTDDWEYFDLGNLGTSQYSMTFAPQLDKGLQSGLNGFSRYQYTREKIKYYRLEKPYSEISYTIGTKRENIFQGRLAQNVKNRLEFGVDFSRIASFGLYQNQRTRNSGFAMYGIYSSKNNRYHLAADLVYNRVKVEENGGIVEDFIDDDNAELRNPLFYDTYLEEDALSEQKNIDLLLTNSYDFGFSQKDSINDTLSVNRFYPTMRFSHSFGIEKDNYSFNDQNPDSTFYGNFYQTDDSIHFDYEMRSIPNILSFDYLGAKNGGDTVTYRNFAVGAFIQQDFVRIKQAWWGEEKFKTQNLHIGAKIQSNDFSASAFKYQIDVAYYLAGYNQHDLHFKSALGYELEKWGKLSATLAIDNVSPSWIENYYFTPSTNIWSTDFRKKNYTNLQLTYDLPKYATKLDFQYTIADNYIFFEQDGSPTQTQKVLNYWKLSLRKDFTFKSVHWDNFVGVQGISHNDIVRIPTFFGKTSLYVQGKIFKGNMLAKVGVDLRYNTNFQIPAWQPITGQFHLQDEKAMTSTPILDVFISMKVNSLRIFAKANYVNQGLFVKDYYVAQNHPSRGRTFAGGLTWRFFE